MSGLDRRLRLVSTKAASPSSGEVTRFVAPEPTFALADAGDGTLAITFAVLLARACADAKVLLCAFDETPGASLGEGFDARTSVFRLGVRKPDDLRDFVAQHREQPSPWVCVGDPAMLACEGAMRIALGAPVVGTVPRARWTQLRKAAQLELFDPQPTIAAALAAAWGRTSSAP